MPKSEAKYYDFIRERLREYEIYDDTLLRKISAAVADLHPAPPKACSCGKPVVFVLFSREFECTRCGKKWQLVMEVRPIS